MHLDGVYAALADSSRRAIVARLANEGELRVTELAEPFDISLNAVSKHIKVLQRAGIVRRRVAGRDHWLSIDPTPLEQGWAWMGLYRRFWETRLDALDAHLRRRRGDATSGGSPYAS
ncbi:MAG TPA: metalloregulator ArsR/SmtB family transcription factor [Dehalococcoidia bacterium]|nr:metalloregulator ArsR/SmtB family transcription factor [Dehalococcoidia bacterium]